MKSNNEIFLAMFESIEAAEDCPVGTELLLWDGCDFHIDYVETDVDTGCCYFANGGSGIAYIELPDQPRAMAILGDGE